MANSGAIRAGRAFVELFADDSKLVRGLKQAAAKLKAWGASIRQVGTWMAGMGAAVLAPLTAAAMSFAKIGDGLDEMSQRTGVSVEVLSELGFAADLAGVSAEALEGGLRKMQKTIVDAAQGSKSAQDALRQLGLTINDLDGLSPDEQFKLIADRLSKVEDPTIRAARAMEIFGKSGTGLLPMMAGGAAGIEALQQQCRKLGLTISTEDAKAAAKFADDLDILWKVLKHGVFVIGSALAPVLSQAVRWITGVAVVISDWIKNNKDLVVWVLKIAAGVLAAGAAIVALGYVVSGIGAVFGALATIVSAVGSVMGVLASVIGFLLSPIGLVIAAVAALGGYLLYATGAGGQALSWLGARFGELRDDALAAFGGISDALAAGDIGLAVKILWLTLKMEWQKGLAALTDLWGGFKSGFMDKVADVWYGAQAIAVLAWADLKSGWIIVTSALSDAWNLFVWGVKASWDVICSWLQKTWNKLKGVFDSSFDVGTANAAVDQASADYQRKILGESGAADKSNAAEKEAALKKVNDQMQESLTRIAGGDAAEQARKAAEEAQKRADAQRELDAAQKEWQAAVEEAHKKRQAKDAQRGGAGALESPEDLIARMKSSMGGLGDLLAQAAGGKVVTTFNASASYGLAGGGNAAERTAKASERTEENTRKLYKYATSGSSFFFAP